MAEVALALVAMGVDLLCRLWPSFFLFFLTFSEDFLALGLCLARLDWLARLALFLACKALLSV